MPLSQGIKIIAYALLLSLVTLSSVQASPLHLTGNWSKPFGDDANQWRLGQSYNLDLTNDITSALRVTGNVRYTTTKQESGSETKTLSPSILLGLNNDLFNLSLNGMQSERQVDSDPKTRTRSWSTTFISAIKDERWPKIRLNFSQNFTDNDANPATTDQETTSFDSGFQYNWSFLTLLYDYTTSTNTNNISNTENKNNNHSARIQAQESFWNNRLSVIASHKYTNSDNTISTTSGSGQIIRPLLPLAGLSSIDDTPLTDPLNPEAGLIDNDLFTATTIELVQPTETLNVGLQTNLENFNELIFYLDREITDDIQTRLHWDFYGSLNNIDWQANLPLATISYANEEGHTLVTVRFANTISNIRYIKAVITSDPGIGTAFISEIEANEITTLSAGDNSLTTKSETHQSQGSISFRPWSKWNIGYNINRTESLPDQSAESIQLSQTLSSSLNWNRYLALSMSVSDSTDEIEGQEEITNRSYALSYRANPIDSLTFSLGGTRTDRFEDSQRTSRSDTLNSHLTATIFPDLTASFSANLTKNTDDIESTESNSKDFKVNLAARFTSSFNVSLNYTYRTSDDSDSSSDYEINSVYRPSSYISLTSGFKHSEKSNNLYSTLNFRLTHKIQTDLHYSYFDAETELHNASFNLTWNISNILNLRQNLAWINDDDDQSWSGLTSINYNF